MSSRVLNFQIGKSNVIKIDEQQNNQMANKNNFNFLAGCHGHDEVIDNVGQTHIDYRLPYENFNTPLLHVTLVY